MKMHIADVKDVYITERSDGGYRVSIRLENVIHAFDMQDAIYTVSNLEGVNKKEFARLLNEHEGRA